MVTDRQSMMLAGRCDETVICSLSALSKCFPSSDWVMNFSPANELGLIGASPVPEGEKVEHQGQQQEDDCQNASPGACHTEDRRVRRTRSFERDRRGDAGGS